MAGPKTAPAPVAAAAAAPAAKAAPAAAVEAAAKSAGTTVSELRGTTVPFTSLQAAVSRNMIESLKVRAARTLGPPAYCEIQLYCSYLGLTRDILFTGQRCAGRQQCEGTVMVTVGWQCQALHAGCHVSGAC